MRRMAVEIKVSQAKKLGWKSNLYIVAGDPVLYASSYQTEIFEVSTNKSKNAFLPLSPTAFPVGNAEPRPKVADGWTRDNSTGLWNMVY